MNTKQKTQLWITGIILGLLMMLGPIFGFLGTVLGMFNAFETLAVTPAGTGQSERLAGDISIALVSTGVGVALALAGLATFLVCLVGLVRCRRKPPPAWPEEQAE